MTTASAPVVSANRDARSEVAIQNVDRLVDGGVSGLRQLLHPRVELGGDPGEQILAFLGRFEDTTSREAITEPACLFVSFIYEHELTDPATIDIIRATIEAWRTRLTQKLLAASRSRPHLATLDLEALADQVFVTFEGAFLLVRATGDPAQMERQLAHLRHYFELLLSPPRGVLRFGPRGGARRSAPRHRARRLS